LMEEDREAVAVEEGSCIAGCQPSDERHPAGVSVG
jgi:hypothetical protein